jgi:hypothetical protein
VLSMVVDLDATIWLSEYLSTRWQGTLLIVSHDAEFLDEARGWSVWGVWAPSDVHLLPRPQAWCRWSHA